MSPHKIVGLLGLVIAVVGAFVNIPQAGLLLLVLGAVAGWGVAGEHHVRVMVSALVLAGLGGSLNTVPAVGGYLADIAGSLAVFSAGGALLIIVRNMVMRFKP
ncbi:MAG: hypothetical protein RL026_947 [Pseudomonadota bacterium]|jgi:hypothetical protein